MTVWLPGWYIADASGQNARSMPAPRALAMSPASSRGYRDRSSLGPNWVGLTKIVRITTSAWARAARTSARWPSWSAPIVGTTAIRWPSRRMSMARACITRGSRKISNGRVTDTSTADGRGAVVGQMEQLLQLLAEGRRRAARQRVDARDAADRGRAAGRRRGLRAGHRVAHELHRRVEGATLVQLLTQVDEQRIGDLVIAP